MERRALGRTGEELSIIGFGGIVVMNTEPPDASRLPGPSAGRPAAAIPPGPAFRYRAPRSLPAGWVDRGWNPSFSSIYGGTASASR